MDEPDLEVCGGTFEALDRHARLTRDALHLGGTDLHVDYSIGDEDFISARCEGGPVDTPFGCTTIADGYVFTRQAFIPHELVHAVRRLDPEVGHLSSVFEEGLATLYGSDPLDTGTVPLDALGLLKDEYIVGNEEYYRAGRMTALLLERHGVETFRDFDLRAASQDENSAFLEAFGEAKEDFATSAESAPLCEQSQWWMPLLECDGPPIEADSETMGLSFSGSLECGQPDVYGPAYGMMWSSRHFRIESATSRLSYTFDMPEDAVLEVVGCDGGCPTRFAYLGDRLAVGSVNNGLPSLEPGEYFLRLSRPVSSAAGEFEITLE